MTQQRGRLNLPVCSRADRDVLIYLQTRMRCRATSRIPEREYARLMEMDPSQIAHYLSEAGYGEQARSLGLTRSGADLVRGIVEKYLLAEMGNIRRICAGSFAARAWLAGYAWKYDLMQLRYAMRAREAGMKPQSPVVLSALANLPAETYQRLIEADTVDLNAPEFAALLVSPFARTLRHHFEEKRIDPEVLEFSLLEDYFHGVIAPMLGRIPLTDPARSILACEVHQINLMTVLSGRLSGLAPERIQARLIPLELWKRADRLRDLLAEKDVAALARGLQELDGSGLFRELAQVRELPATESGIERLLRRLMLTCMRRSMRSALPSVAGVLGYVILVELEGRNLMALALGKQLDASTAEIAETLITGQGVLARG